MAIEDDLYRANAPARQTFPAARIRAVTPSDDNDLPDGVCKAIWVSTDGNVELIAELDQTPVTLVGASAGTIIPVRAKRILAGTTSVVLAFY